MPTAVGRRTHEAHRGPSRLGPILGRSDRLARAVARPSAGVHLLGTVRGKSAATARQQHEVRSRGPTRRMLAAGRAGHLRACGRRMSIEYANRSKPRLTCNADRNHLGVSQCQSLIAQPLERLVARQVLIALEPASLELSLAAADQVEAGRRRLQDFHEQGLERARYEAERAWRQYTAVEPENRLVAQFRTTLGEGFRESACCRGSVRSFSPRTAGTPDRRRASSHPGTGGRCTLAMGRS